MSIFEHNEHIKKAAIYAVGFVACYAGYLYHLYKGCEEIYDDEVIEVINKEEKE